MERSFSDSSLITLVDAADHVQCGSFRVNKAADTDSAIDSNSSKHLNNYCLHAPTTSSNVQRLARCMLLSRKPIMLEGSPGVGKTSLVEALGALTRHHVVRINLSEQTDLSELFGADLPRTVAGSATQHFDWLDGPLLRALKSASWIILDEINLASQSVLEGLNSVLDHRGELFISELNRSFRLDATRGARIFACQNPYAQGGGRKGLPRSFLNRFSKLYVDEMKPQDLELVAASVYSPRIGADTLARIVHFNEALKSEFVLRRSSSGRHGELNVRDIFRWCDLLTRDDQSSDDDDATMSLGDYVYLVYGARLRTSEERERVYACFHRVFGYWPYMPDAAGARPPIVRFSASHVQIGHAFLVYDKERRRNETAAAAHVLSSGEYTLTSGQLPRLEALAKCVQMGWMCQLVGASHAGKTSLVRMLAALVGQPLVEFAVSQSTDTSDLLGGFDRAKPTTPLVHACSRLIERIEDAFLSHLRCCQGQGQRQRQQFLSSYLQFRHDAQNALHRLEAVASGATSDDNNDNEADDWLAVTRSIRDQLVPLFDAHLSFVVADAASFDASLAHIKQACGRESGGGSATRLKFEWMDSSLVRAIECGEWVLVDNANFCSPSVLDRLNPLLETPNGCLHISERGGGGGSSSERATLIRPHANFRLFLCMNDSFGELSRPMRNRGVEIYVDHQDGKDEEGGHDDSGDNDDQRLILSTMFDDLLNHTALYDKALAYVVGAEKTSSSSGAGPLMRQQRKHQRFAALATLLKLTQDYWHLGQLSSPANGRDTNNNNNNFNNCNNKTELALECLDKAAAELRLAPPTQTSTSTLAKHTQVFILLLYLTVKD